MKRLLLILAANAVTLAAGLVAGDLYRSTDAVNVVH